MVSVFDSDSAAVAACVVVVVVSGKNSVINVVEFDTVAIVGDETILVNIVDFEAVVGMDLGGSCCTHAGVWQVHACLELQSRQLVSPAS